MAVLRRFSTNAGSVDDTSANSKRDDRGTNRRTVCNIRSTVCNIRSTVCNIRSTDMDNRTRNKDTDMRPEIRSRYQPQRPRWNSAPTQMRSQPLPRQSKIISSFLFHLPKLQQLNPDVDPKV